MTKLKILFVCLGNICRSPLAEAVFSEKVRKAGLAEEITIDSCGTGGYHIGHQPDPRSIAVATAHRIPIGHEARQLRKSDLRSFNYVVGMDDQNIRDILALDRAPTAEVVKMRQFDRLGPNLDVPDPYYGGDEGFEQVYQMLDRSSDVFLSYLIETHGLDRP